MPINIPESVHIPVLILSQISHCIFVFCLYDVNFLLEKDARIVEQIVGHKKLKR